MSELGTFYDDITSFLSSQRFSVFTCSSNSKFSKSMSTILWNEDEEYEDFFQIAKNEGVTIIFESVHELTEDDLEDLFDKLPDDLRDTMESELEETREKIRSTDNRVSVSFFWIKDNIRYMIQKNSWLEDIIFVCESYGKLAQDSENLPKPQHARSDYVYEELRSQDPNELARELHEYIMDVDPDPSDRMRSKLTSAFWDEKGLKGTEHLDFKQEIDILAHRITRKKSRKQPAWTKTSNLSLAELTQKCIIWARRKKIKPTQAVLRSYLLDNDVILNPADLKLLHRNVSSSLK